MARLVGSDLGCWLLALFAASCSSSQVPDAAPRKADPLARHATPEAPIDTTDAGDGGASYTTLATDQPTILGIAVHDDTVYWTRYAGTGPAGDGEIVSCPLDGCSGAPTVVVSGQTKPHALVIAGGSLYWFSGKHIVGAPLTGGATTTLATANEDLNGLAAHDGRLYWTECTYPKTNGYVKKCDIADCKPKTLASGQDYPHGVAVDDDNAYWVNGYGGEVMQVPVAGGTSITLASGQAYPWRIAVDATTVYWTNDERAVMSCSIGGCGGSPTVLASGYSATDLAVSGGRVYFTDANLGLLSVPLGGGETSHLANAPANGAYLLALSPNAIAWSGDGPKGEHEAVLTIVK